MVYHEPVLAKESIEALAIKSDGAYVDATFGGGGHSYSSGFKMSLKGRPFNEVKSECTQYAAQLLDELEQE